MCAELYHDNGLLLLAYHIVVVSSIPNLISMFLQKASLEASLADIQNRYGMRLAGYQNQVSTLVKPVDHYQYAHRNIVHKKSS